MALNPSTALILNGVGTGMLIANTGEIFEITKGQNMGFEITTSEEDVYGGDSLFPFFTFVKEKGGKISIDDATFNLNQLKVTQNATINTTTAKKHFREEIVVSGAAAASLTVVTASVVTDTVVIYNKATGVALTNTGAVTPTTVTQFKITALGAITFGAAVTGTFVVSGYATDATASASATVMSNTFPGTVELRWNLVTQDESGNSFMVSLRAKKCKCSGKFNADFKRGTASVQKLEFKVLEPSDGSKEFIEVIVTDL